MAGVTAKLAALALVPSDVPPVADVYQLMLLPVDVAFKFDVPLMQTVAGLALTEVGADGNVETKTVVVTELVQLLAFE